MAQDDSTRLNILETGLQQVNLTLEGVKVNQNLMKEQQTLLLSKVELIGNSLGDPAQSSLGRSLVREINGMASRFDTIIAEEKKEREAIKQTVAELHGQSLMIQGALGLIKFVGFTALFTAIVALITIFLQLFQVIKAPNA